MHTHMHDTTPLSLPPHTYLSCGRKCCFSPHGVWGCPNPSHRLRFISRSRALIAVMQSAEGREPLYLANVHLEAGNEKAPQRLSQLRSLLKRLQHQRAIDVAASSGRPRSLAPRSDAAAAAILIAGDFNFDRRSALFGLLATGVNGEA